jgi:hypothetical protein
MALTDVGICSAGLVLLGEDTISGFTESDAAATCGVLYELRRETLLSMYPWRFATTKRQLAQSTTSPINEWTYAYTLPSNRMSGPAVVFTGDDLNLPPLKQFEIFGNELFANETEIWIDYRFKPEEARYPPYFTQLAVYDMAAHLAFPITEDETKGKYWWAIAYGTPQEEGKGGFFRTCRNLDSQQQPSPAVETFELITARSGS